MNALRRLATNPKHAQRWLKDRIVNHSPLQQAVPWTSFPCVEFLERHVTSGMKVFEYGGGGSTRYFLQRGCSVTTVESDSGWAAEIRKYAESDGASSRLEVRYRPVTDSTTASEYVSELAIGGPWDIVLIDGLENSIVSRTDCLDAINALPDSVDWLVVLDDAWRSKYSAHRLDPKGYKCLELVGLGPARWGVTRSDVYFRKGGRFDRL